MKTSEVLREALDHLGPNGQRWVKEPIGNANRACAVGAVNWVVSGLTSAHHWAAYFPARCAVNALASEIDGVDMMNVASGIGSWNDDPHTTWEDVRLTFKRAIARAEELEEAS